MDNERVARELVKMAKDLQGSKSRVSRKRQSAVDLERDLSIISKELRIAAKAVQDVAYMTHKLLRRGGLDEEMEEKLQTLDSALWAGHKMIYDEYLDQDVEDWA